MFCIRGSLINNTSQRVCCSDKILYRGKSIMKKPILYGDEASPPVRFVMMTASLLKIDLEFHKIDLFKSENKTEFYKEINPLLKVPALSVNGGVICDSHAIALYFCRTRTNQELYPKEKLLRAKIDELLYFNSGVLFPIDSAVFSKFFASKQLADETTLVNWYTSLDHLERKLSEQKWLTGDKMRLCDVCCGSTVSSLEILIPLSDRHENVKNWLEKLTSLPCFDINKRGLKRLQSFIEIIKQQS